MNLNDQDRTFVQRVNRKLKGSDEKSMMIITLLGMGTFLTRYIVETDKLNNAPVDVKYCMATITANLLAMISDNPNVNIQNMSSDNPINTALMSEQTQEIIYRRAKYVITELYKSIQEKEEM